MRPDGRSPDALRPVTLEPGWQRQGDGSVLYRAGGTVVLCVASVEEGVKDFLRGRNQGWVTAEYLMHPRAGARRQNRDGFNGRSLSGRSHEIARLIGRSLRAAVDLGALGERTITLDCDVLEADGGTRTASITGAMVALVLALDGLARASKLPGRPLRTLVSAVSAGVYKHNPCLDLCYVEDRDAAMDLNLVATHDGAVVELQCTAEHAPVPRSTVDALVDLGVKGCAALGAVQRETLKSAGVDLARLQREPRG
ncbi:MAG: ribonuclease PH [Deltaproteobacteria bacterium]|nr:ribonuclease PH [Deltaproteobacteria bacterium]